MIGELMSFSLSIPPESLPGSRKRPWIPLNGKAIHDTLFPKT